MARRSACTLAPPFSLPRIADGAAYGVVSRLEEDLDWPTIHQAGHDPIPPVVGVDGGGSMVTLRFADHLGTGLIENISSVNGPLIAGVLVVPRWALCRPGTWHCALAI